MKRILDIFKYDLLAFIPGSGIPLTIHAFLKLILYAGFVLFCLQLFYFSTSSRPAMPRLEKTI
ncbi:MAG: hypothetical protein JNM27_05655 [Leptospirales bacterium]|nr:hypothetical protein [Leptospirales bacterium]